MIILLIITIFLTLILVYFIINLVKNIEKYEYKKDEDPGTFKCDKCYQTGQSLVGGTVFASYPDQSPGLGWVL